VVSTFLEVFLERDKKNSRDSFDPLAQKRKYNRLGKLCFSLVGSFHIVKFFLEEMKGSKKKESANLIVWKF
jgi:hypothetical protein